MNIDAVELALQGLKQINVSPTQSRGVHDESVSTIQKAGNDDSYSAACRIFPNRFQRLSHLGAEHLYESLRLKSGGKADHFAQLAADRVGDHHVSPGRSHIYRDRALILGFQVQKSRLSAADLFTRPCTFDYKVLVEEFIDEECNIRPVRVHEPSQFRPRDRLVRLYKG
jgi:hypothetical protein